MIVCLEKIAVVIALSISLIDEVIKRLSSPKLRNKHFMNYSTIYV